MATSATNGQAKAADGAKPSASGRDYLHDITIAKGLAIFLVVLGHVVTGRPPAGNEWYTAMRTAIYAFHMPFFIYLSGYIFFYTDSASRAWRNFPEFVGRRAERLLVPFLLFGLLIIVGKHVAVQFIHVDNIGRSALEEIANLFWNTRNSAAQSVWYVFVLFEMTLFAVLALRLVRSPLILFAIAVPLSLLPVLPVLYLDRFFLYLPFFFVGGIVVRHRATWNALMDRYLWLFLTLFAAAIVATRILSIYHLSILACGLTAIPALHGLCRLAAVQGSRLLDALGRYSFPIYLLNTIALGVAKGVLLLFMSWDGANFLIFLPVMLVVGIIGPILVKTLVFRRVRWIDKITD